MKLHEYQARARLKAAGVPVPDGDVASTPDEVERIAKEMGGGVVVKAQVHTGGRGKAGGVKVAADAAEAGAIAGSLIGTTLVTFQTGPGGAPVERVLVEQTVDIDRELYFSVITDGERRRPVVIVSSAGGMEIEEVARETPDRRFGRPNPIEQDLWVVVAACITGVSTLGTLARRRQLFRLFIEEESDHDQ